MPAPVHVLEPIMPGAEQAQPHAFAPKPAATRAASAQNVMFNSGSREQMFPKYGAMDSSSSRHVAGFGDDCASFGHEHPQAPVKLSACSFCNSLHRLSLPERDKCYECSYKSIAI